ncbi:hypothetical protein, partial [Actinoalloteichus caeruleus]|uniref:hypothetical protein n=1 Tax=Actinoalloteichus cyanogriseus TaxID=2893586 RepID=UPI001B807F83
MSRWGQGHPGRLPPRSAPGDRELVVRGRSGRVVAPGKRAFPGRERPPGAPARAGGVGWDAAAMPAFASPSGQARTASTLRRHRYPGGGAG